MSININQEDLLKHWPYFEELKQIDLSKLRLIYFCIAKQFDEFISMIILDNQDNYFICDIQREFLKNIQFENFKKLKNLPPWKVVKICRSSTHFLALTCEGQVFGWGSNRNKELQNSIHGYFEDPILIDVPAIGLVINIECGISFSMFSTNFGNVYAKGDNEFGQISKYYSRIPGNHSIINAPLPASFIASSGTCNFIIDQSGQVIARGDYQKEKYYAVPLRCLKNYYVVKIIFGMDTSLVLTRDGLVLNWIDPLTKKENMNLTPIAKRLGPFKNIMASEIDPLYGFINNKNEIYISRYLNDFQKVDYYHIGICFNFPTENAIWILKDNKKEQDYEKEADEKLLKLTN